MLVAGRGSRSRSNAWAQWKVCAKWSLRLEYVPRVGAPGHCRSAGPLPQDVKLQLEEIGEEKVTPDDLVTKQVALDGAERGRWWVGWQSKHRRRLWNPGKAQKEILRRPICPRRQSSARMASVRIQHCQHLYTSLGPSLIFFIFSPLFGEDFLFD